MPNPVQSIRQLYIASSWDGAVAWAGPWTDGRAMPSRVRRAWQREVASGIALRAIGCSRPYLSACKYQSPLDTARRWSRFAARPPGTQISEGREDPSGRMVYQKACHSMDRCEGGTPWGHGILGRQGPTRAIAIPSRRRPTRGARTVPLEGMAGTGLPHPTGPPSRSKGPARGRAGDPRD